MTLAEPLRLEASGPSRNGVDPAAREALIELWAGFFEAVLRAAPAATVGTPSGMNRAPDAVQKPAVSR
jgi:hypothetical protein